MTTLRFALFFFLMIPVFAREPGLRDFHQVDANVCRGRQPSDEGFQALSKMGVKTIIDMRGGFIHLPREKKVVNGLGMQYVEERFSGIFAPRDEQVAKLLAVMEDPASTPVFVHCRRGADRVGVLIACYRMAHDHWTNEQAYQEARQLGLSPLEPIMRYYIRHFDPKRLHLPAGSAPASPVAKIFDFTR